MPRMKNTSFFNFFPTKAEEESSSSGNGEAASSSKVSIRKMGPKTTTANYMSKWTFTKELTNSDVQNPATRLALPQGVMRDSILCYFWGGANVSEGHEENVSVKDVDTNSYHEMVIFRDRRTNLFFMKGHWKRDFLTRRSLQVGDVIGFCWNNDENCLEFSVLQTN